MSGTSTTAEFEPAPLARWIRAEQVREIEERRILDAAVAEIHADLYEVSERTMPEW